MYHNFLDFATARRICTLTTPSDKAPKECKKNANCSPTVVLYRLLFLPRLENQKKKKIDEDANEDELYFKYLYHPKDISCLTLRKLYEEHCEKPNSNSDGFKNFRTPEAQTMRIKKLTIAYRRDENLRDRIMPSTLFKVPGKPASFYLQNL